MSITVPTVVAERGKADAKRHRDKQRELIKKRLPAIISEEAIITRRERGKIVKIPIKEIQIPVFRHGSAKDRVGGVGQGKGDLGDVIGRRSAPGTQPGKSGKPGSEPGVDYIETEVEIEELIEMMLEDLGLPRLEDKNVREIVVELGYKIHGTQHSGPYVLLDKRKTAKEGVRRFWHTLRSLMRETGRDEITCYRALKQAQGIFEDAQRLLKDEGVVEEAEAVVPFPILHADDMRFHKIERDTTLHSRAVVFALMDVSGSMDDEKRYFARSMLFWLVEFLRKLYTHVEIRFITHHSTARLVPEEEFFATGESGGTMCAPAYDMVNDLIESEYPVSQWNSYVWHSSDGDDFDPDGAVASLRKLFGKGINMFGYCDIRPGEEKHSPLSGLLVSFAAAFKLSKGAEGDLAVYASRDEHTPFLGVQLRRKEDILPALKAFLKQDRWAEK